MNLCKTLTATCLAVAAGAALCAMPAMAQTMSPMHSMHPAASLHQKAVMNAHKATMAARMGHPRRSARLAAKAQRQYNASYRMRMHRMRRVY